MSSSDSEDSVQVQIRERDAGVDTYVKPSLLVEYEQDVAKENELLAAAGEGGSDDDEEEESMDESDEEEDEEAAMLTPAIDTQIFKTIAAIKSKAPGVYDSTKKFFTDEQFKASKEQWEQQQANLKSQDKKMTLKDYERKMLLEHGGYVKEDDEEDHNDDENGLTHVEEQAQLKKAFQLAAQQDDDDEDDNTTGLKRRRQDDSDEESDEDDGFLVKRDKSKTELDAEEDDYRSFLLSNLKDDEASSKAFEDWENFKENPNVNADDAFLMDYVLNRGWVDKKGKQNPTYNEIVDVDKDMDEQYLDDVDRFESKYNFRYEEEGGAHIVTHARDVGDSVRRKESKRKQRRDRIKAKKQAAKEQKTEELKRIKNEKRKEIHDRLLEIQKITGTEVTGFENMDLEGDFDPEKYDEQMSNIFNNDYYQGDDTEKPVFDDDLDDDDMDYDEGEGGGDDDEDLMMDADYLPGGEKYQASKKNKKKGKTNEQQDDEEDDTAAAPSSSTPKKAKDSAYNKLMDEYYALDFEDVVGGDLATRFKYTQTEPEDYGLSAVDILLADDKELNKYLSIRTLAPYRNETQRQSEMNTFRKNKRNRFRELQMHLNKKQKGEYSDKKQKSKHTDKKQKTKQN